MGKTALSSKTIRFHMTMIGLQTITGGFAAFQPFMEPLHFVIVSGLLGLAQSVGGVYFRFITTEPIRK